MLRLHRDRASLGSVAARLTARAKGGYLAGHRSWRGSGCGIGCQSVVAVVAVIMVNMVVAAVVG